MRWTGMSHEGQWSNNVISEGEEECESATGDSLTSSSSSLNNYVFVYLCICLPSSVCRINGQLVVLTSALQTWTQLDLELGEFTVGLDKYRTLYELKDVLDRGDVQLPSDTVMDVRQVSRLLTERIEAYQQVSCRG